MEKPPSPHQDKLEEPAGKAPAEKEPELVFYYSRARRLERASPAVRALNDAAPAKPPSLFRTLTATKPLTLLFMSIVIIVVICFIALPFSSRETRPALGGNFLTFSALRFEGSSYIVIKRTVAEKKEPYTGIVDMAISVYKNAGEESPADPPITNRRIFFSPEPEEEYRFALPFEARELFFIMRAGEEYLSARVKTE
jgi:hypothetical protein